jgi:glycosyltransferase involved in cell wall biosynthesis
MKYTIVIPTYNHCEKYLKPCIDSIIKHTDMEDIELIVSANGCTDNTEAYLTYLATAIPHLKYTISKEPLGYAKATNRGIELATTDKIVLLNNDTILLNQNKNQWLQMLDAPFQNPNCGISCIIKQQCEPAGREFAVFFCVMVHRNVFTTIGLLNEEYGVGSGEDVEFCIEAEEAGFEVIQVSDKHFVNNQFTGSFPIYHVGEGTVHDANLVQNWNNIFHKNHLKLAKKYRPDYYRWMLTNNFERAVFLKGDSVFVRETARYQWANQNLLGNKVLEIGCSTGYGTQFLPSDIDYLGLDYDPIIIEVAKDQGWLEKATFCNADINQYELGQYDTIIAFEFIEHIDNGLEIVEKLKKHCKRLLITVPYNEPKGFWGEHHKLHGLNESHFTGFEFEYINGAGEVLNAPAPITEQNQLNLMICKYSAQ